MAIKVPFDQKVPQLVIDLRGSQGNVFYLIGTGKMLAHQLGLDWDKIYKRMTRGDYIQAVKIFNAYFGQFVTLYVSEEFREQLTA